MKTESLTGKLERLLPGARAFLARHRRAPNASKVKEYSVTVEEWRVERDGRVLAVGASEREAIDRALFLYGAQR